MNNGGCEQICVPLVGNARTCLCSSGFTLDSQTSGKCTGYDSFLLVSRGDEIFGVSMDDKHSDAMTPIGGQTIVDIEIEFASQTIFYADTSGANRGINKIGRDGSGMKQLIHERIGQYGIQSIAVDWINCKQRRSSRICYKFFSFNFNTHCSVEEKLISYNQFEI